MTWFFLQARDTTKPQQTQHRKTASPSRKTKKKKKGKEVARSQHSSSPAPSTSSPQSTSAPADPVLDRCLDEMGDSLKKLKGLALDIGDELSRQNKLLDHVVPKAKEAEVKVTLENRNARRLLL